MVNPSALNSDRSVVTVAPMVIVAGTATDVGKTWLTARLIERLSEAGWIVSARKPVQSFDQADDPNGRDASVLAAASGESRDVVCPPHRSYELAMAPPIAAELLGREPWTIDDLVAEHHTRRANPRSDIELIELAGGVFSPIAAADDSRFCAGGDEFIQAISPHLVVLVADAALGAIDAVRSHILARTWAGSFRLLVFLNRFDGDDLIAVNNLRWLTEVDGLDGYTDIAEMAAAVVGMVPTYCVKCGGSACEGACRGDLEPDRYCQRCGRRLSVRVAPTSVTARCAQHGALVRR